MSAGFRADTILSLLGFVNSAPYIMISLVYVSSQNTPVSNVLTSTIQVHAGFQIP
jgi:hypothetical protein